MRRLRFALAAVALMSAVGCAHYEYDLIQPVVPGAHAGAKEDFVLTLDPLNYHLRSVDDRLVVRVFNPTPDSIELVGAKSAVVDPTGQSRPIRGQVLPPGAFAKFILPPVRPQFVGDSPRRIDGSYGYGGFDSRREFGLGGYYDDPVTYTLRDGGENYWDWKGETSARLVLTFVRAGKEFKQELVFGRRRMD